MMGTPVREAPTTESDSVLDDTGYRLQAPNASGVSILGGSAIRHNRRCAECSEPVPYWFAKCPQCNAWMTDPS